MGATLCVVGHRVADHYRAVVLLLRSRVFCAIITLKYAWHNTTNGSRSRAATESLAMFVERYPNITDADLAEKEGCSVNTVRRWRKER